MNKRILSLLLALLMILYVFPLGAFAAESSVQRFVEVNPLYADTVSESDIPLPSSSGGKSAPLLKSVSTGGHDYKTSIAELGAEMRKAMVGREAEFHLYYCSDKSLSASSLFSQIKQEALKHTGNSFEGDYIRWSYGGLGGEVQVSRSSGKYYYILDIGALYYTTAAQEKAVSERIDELFCSFGLEKDASDYAVIKTVYDYICANVSYDYDTVDDDSYDLKFTAYAALFNGTAICQGYAALLYAMLLHEGVDARVISGGGHGWNIARAGDKYYNLDSTWDAGCDPDSYNWFMKCPGSFSKHQRSAEYTTAQFNAAYPMSEVDYPLHNWDSGVVTKEPTCTESGLMLYTCTDADCGKTKTETIPATEHSYSNGRCTVCGAKEDTGFLSSFLVFFRDLFAWIRSLFIFFPAAA